MKYSNINFNKKTILITGGAGFMVQIWLFIFKKITLNQKWWF